MSDTPFTENDLYQIQSHGLTLETVRDQIRKFEKGTPYLKLNRPCIPGDGIQQLDEGVQGECLEKFETRARKKRLLKFVPASGAATRMFKTLIKANNRYNQIHGDDVEKGLLETEEENQEIRDFFQGLRRFAFFPELEKTMAGDRLDVKTLLTQKDLKPFLDYLLTEKGLNYAKKPKGLLGFHTYPDEARTAFEEHLVEAAEYSRMENRECRLHFTVSPEHQSGFESLLSRAAGNYEPRLETRFSVDFSFQSPETDTIAVDMENQPFRRDDGSLLFRPGGHGALLDNLNRIDSDIVFIKNIDNVVHDRFKTETTQWKQILCGYLLLVQEQIFSYLETLETGPATEACLEEITRFVETTLGVTPPPLFRESQPKARRDYLMDRLDRPLRVCGMVPNSGEPGGGPFWVAEKDGHLSIQIVETSQIDPEDKGQQAIQQDLTHFNPVDLVCAIRDKNGKTFDLSRFVDRDAVFIASKSESGRDLKALEHPGLWNGAMAYWNSVFLEVPLITFNPVKRINDLLRSPHQPEY